MAAAAQPRVGLIADLSSWRARPTERLSAGSASDDILGVLKLRLQSDAHRGSAVGQDSSTVSKTVVSPKHRAERRGAVNSRCAHGHAFGVLRILGFFIFACHLLAGMATVVKQASKQASNVFRLISLLACYRRQWTGAES